MHKEKSLLEYKREAREYKKALVGLTTTVLTLENAIDEQMKHPWCIKRDTAIASIMNGLTLANHMAMHFGLGYSFKKINKLYGNTEKGGENGPSKKR
jgi:hypothetical protein